MGNNKRPLEWSSLHRAMAATEANPVNSKINLALRDDEVAEIHKIIVETQLSLAATTTSARLDFVMSMDPDVKDDPGEEVTWEDLEVFYGEGRIRTPKQLVADIDEIVDDFERKDLNFSPPILVGTDIGISSQVTWLTADSAAVLKLKVFFTRRKANVQELNQILLKRR